MLDTGDPILRNFRNTMKSAIF